MIKHRIQGHGDLKLKDEKGRQRRRENLVKSLEHDLIKENLCSQDRTNAEYMLHFLYKDELKCELEKERDLTNEERLDLYANLSKKLSEKPETPNIFKSLLAPFIYTLILLGILALAAWLFQS